MYLSGWNDNALDIVFNFIPSSDVSIKEKTQSSLMDDAFFFFCDSGVVIIHVRQLATNSHSFKRIFLEEIASSLVSLEKVNKH